MFSGQGSQYWDMGKMLYENNAVFRRWMLEMDDLVQSKTDKSVVTYLYGNGGDGSFDALDYSHPAIFMVEYALAQTLDSQGIRPDIVLGSSLGEITAATVASAIDVEAALENIIKQARIVQSTCHQGNMMAVLHNVDLYEKADMLNQLSTLVSVNFDDHFVISGSSTEIKEIKSFLDSNRIISQLLPVRYAFHSPFIDPAEEPYKRVLRSQDMRSPTVKMVSSLDGQTVSQLQGDYFWEVIREPMQFRKAIRQIENSHHPIYVDLSPSSTLANFVKRNINHEDLACFSFMSPFHQELKNLEYIQHYQGKLRTRA